MSNMKILVLVVVLGLTAACGSSPKVETEPVANTNDQSKRVAETVASHSVERDDVNAVTQSDADVPEASKGGKRKWSRSGDAIDTSKFDAAIAAAKAKSDENAKKALGTAYFERGVALTAARQYASAIGDFRKAVDNDPANDEAKKQIATITSIYNSMNIEVPGVGEEPAALEFKKEKE